MTCMKKTMNEINKIGGGEDDPEIGVKFGAHEYVSNDVKFELSLRIMDAATKDIPLFDSPNDIVNHYLGKSRAVNIINDQWAIIINTIDNLEKLISERIMIDRPKNLNMTIPPRINWDNIDPFCINTKCIAELNNRIKQIDQYLARINVPFLGPKPRANFPTPEIPSFAFEPGKVSFENEKEIVGQILIPIERYYANIIGFISDINDWIEGRLRRP